VDGREIVASQPVISGGDAAEVLEPAEHTFDGVAAAIERDRPVKALWLGEAVSGYAAEAA